MELTFVGVSSSGSLFLFSFLSILHKEALESREGRRKFLCIIAVRNCLMTEQKKATRGAWSEERAVIVPTPVIIIVSGTFYFRIFCLFLINHQNKARGERQIRIEKPFADDGAEAFNVAKNWSTLGSLSLSLLAKKD
jgi:hypothetical protein